MELDLETIGTLSGPDSWGGQIARLRRLATDGRTYAQSDETKTKRITTRNLNKEKRREKLRNPPAAPTKEHP